MLNRLRYLLFDRRKDGNRRLEDRRRTSCEEAAARLTAAVHDFSDTVTLNPEKVERLRALLERAKR